MCNNFTYYRTLGYDGSTCAVTHARFGAGPALSPIWMSEVRCSSDDNCLQDCSFIGLDNPIRSCSHREDAGVVCTGPGIANCLFLQCKYMFGQPFCMFNLVIALLCIHYRYSYIYTCIKNYYM